MITKISGILEAVTETSIILDREGMSFEVLAPRYFTDELRERLPRGESIRLHTKLIIEAGIALSSMRPAQDFASLGTLVRLTNSFTGSKYISPVSKVWETRRR